MVFCNDRHYFEVIDNDGNVVATYRDEEEAFAQCAELGLPNREISWQELTQMRLNSGIYTEGQSSDEKPSSAGETREPIKLHYPNLRPHR